MKFLSTSAFGLALALAALSPAMAQYAPGGSYQQSCVDVRAHANSISAQCTAPNGQYVQSRLSLPCYGDIANSNGYLRCNGNGGGGYYPPGGGRPPGGGNGYLPSGSYQSSCRNAYANGSNLTAECTATNGAWIRSSLQTYSCRQGTDIANINGRLSCLYYR